MKQDITKKKINSKQKGSRAEFELAKILTGRFGESFARVGVSSGARVKNTKLPDNAASVMTGDLMVPSGFKFSIESKSVNINIDFLDQSAPFDKWLFQATADAESIGKIPFLAWKRNRKGWVAAVPFYAFAKSVTPYPLYFSMYRSWVIVKLEALLSIKNGLFWFGGETQ
jgi:Holliday junction resolvase